MSKQLIKNSADHKPTQVAKEFGERILDKVKDQIEDAKKEVYAEFGKTLKEDFDEEFEAPVDALEGIKYDEESEGWVPFNENLSDDAIAERKLVVKVNAKGIRRKKVVCGPGKKFKDGRCVIQSAGEKIARKKGSKKSVRKKKGKSQVATKRKRKLALKKRKAQGL